MINYQLYKYTYTESLLNIILIYLGIPLVLLWTIPDHIYSILITSICQLVFTFKKLYSCILNPKYRNNPFIMSAWVYFIFLGSAPLLLYTNIELIESDWNQWIYQEGFDNKSILKAQLVLNIFGTFLFIIGNRLSFFFIKFYNIIFNNLSNNLFYFTFLSLILSVFQVYFIVTGKISLGGISKNALIDGIDPVLSFLFPCFYVIPFLCGFYVKFKKKVNILWVLILLLQIFWFFLLNKRSMFLAIYLFSLSFYRFEYLKFSRKNIYILSIFIFLFYVSATVFQGLRTIGLNNIINNQEYYKLEFIFQNPEILEDDVVIESNRTYKVSRPFSTHIPISKFFFLIENQNIFFLNGEGLINTFKNATPSNFFFDKERVLVNELLYSYKYGSLFDYDDTGDSIVLQGLIDYGLGGVIVYSLLFFFLFYACFIVLVKHSPVLIYILFLCQTVNLLLNSYEETFGEVFSFVRILIVISFISALVLNIKYSFVLLSKKLEFIVK